MADDTQAGYTVGDKVAWFHPVRSPLTGEDATGTVTLPVDGTGGVVWVLPDRGVLSWPEPVPVAVLRPAAGCDSRG